MAGNNLTDPDNPLHRFIAYHCLPLTLYLNQLDSFNYHTLAGDELINVKLTGEFLLNSHTETENGIPVEKYVRIIRNNSNISGKNGVIHSIDKLLEIYDPQPVYFVFDFTSYQGINIGHSYSKEELKLLEGIKTENKTDINSFDNFFINLRIKELFQRTKL